MPKSKVTDWDVTAANNTDIGGIGAQGTDKPSNFDNTQREILAQVAKVNAGTDPVADTWTFGDPADLTKRARLDAGNVTAGQTRVIKAPDFDIDLTNLMRVFRGFIFGLTLSNAADTDHDITIAAGTAASDDSNPTLINLSSAITKQADATFAEGSAAGGMVSGESLPTSGTVHVWLIMKADGTADVCFNNNASSGLSPTLPSGFTYKRRIASLRTDASANIRNFLQVGDYFQYKVPVLDVASAAQGTSGTNRSISAPVGIKTRAELMVLAFSTTNGFTHISDPDRGSLDTPTYYTSYQPSNVFTTSNLWVETDVVGQVRSSMSGSGTALNITTRGWLDTRGRLA